MPKIPKAVAGYLPPQNVALGGTSCGSCRDYVPYSRECMILIESLVSADKGTCILYLLGPNPEYRQPLHLVSAKAVGYIEGPEVPTSCGRCKHYEHPQQMLSTCDGIGDFRADEVAAGGCCNHYELRKGG